MKLLVMFLCLFPMVTRGELVLNPNRRVECMAAMPSGGLGGVWFHLDLSPVGQRGDIQVTRAQSFPTIAGGTPTPVSNANFRVRGGRNPYVWGQTTVADPSNPGATIGILYSAPIRLDCNALNCSEAEMRPIRARHKARMQNVRSVVQITRNGRTSNAELFCSAQGQEAQRQTGAQDDSDRGAESMGSDRTSPGRSTTGASEL